MFLVTLLTRLLLSSLILWAATVAAGDWPGFRGPTGQGLSAEAAVPLEWGPEKNIAWRTEIPGAGWSSPIYLAGRVYLTTAIPIAAGQANDQLLTALCLDAADGSVAWQKTVFEQSHEATAGIHDKNSHASPTPICDGERLYVHFGTHGTACLSLSGEIQWTNRELKYAPQHGNGGSPTLVDDLLVVNCDGSDVQYVAALERTTGKIRWRKDRPSTGSKKGFSFSTPLIVELEGEHQIISPASDQLIAYRPHDGKELWRFEYTGYSVVPCPAFADELLFFSSGFNQPTLYVLRPMPNGQQPEVVWSTGRGAPHTPSPLVVGKQLYLVSDRGVGTCLDAATGEVHWVKRLGGNYSASPVYAGGHIYFQNEEGGTVVIEPGSTYREAARNNLPGRTLASYAVADSSIFLRTDSHLYRIQEQ